MSTERRNDRLNVEEKGIRSGGFSTSKRLEAGGGELIEENDRLGGGYSPAGGECQGGGQ